jgi:hypothetical protein
MTRTLGTELVPTQSPHPRRSHKSKVTAAYSSATTRSIVSRLLREEPAVVEGDREHLLSQGAQFALDDPAEVRVASRRRGPSANAEG